MILIKRVIDIEKLVKESNTIKLLNCQIQLNHLTQVMSEEKPKALRITATLDSKTDRVLVPINTDEFISLESAIGSFKLSVNIKQFKGSEDYNESNSKYDSEKENNLVIRIEFRPTKEINGNDLIFGNDFDSPIRDYLPYGTSFGLKMFSKFVDPSCTYDLYADKPWIYGKCLSSFNKIHVSLDNEEQQQLLLLQQDWSENLAGENSENEELNIPLELSKRQSFFAKQDNCAQYTFLPGFVYRFEFSNDYLSLKDNKLGIVLPGGFELNLVDYLSKDIEKSCNFVLKKGGNGLVIKFEYV